MVATSILSILIKCFGYIYEVVTSDHGVWPNINTTLAE